MLISTQQVNYWFIFYIHRIFEKKLKYNEAVHQLFMDFKKASDSDRSEVLYNILTAFRIPMKLVRPTKCV